MTEQLNQPLSRRDFLKLGASSVATAALALSPLAAQAASKPKQTQFEKAMAALPQDVVETLKAKDFSGLLGNVPGFSDAQLKAHFKLYENYVSKTNLLNSQIAQADSALLSGANGAYAPFREMQVELSFNHNGVVLHELYFGNLGAKGEPGKNIKTMLIQAFGSWENYIAHLVACGKAARGWVITGFDMLDGKFRNYVLDSHNQGVPVHVYPIIVLDVFEHAYFIDYATDRGKYLDAFISNLNWPTIENRLLFAVHHFMSGPKATE